ncbi:MAG: DNA polymerase III subunit gamma/tau [Bacteroidetes bacterium]|nr:DNA polymerase III subunit gamma/tau [Bacteroidota bacterium]
MSQSQYLVTARKYRPRRFSELVAQSHVAQALMNALRLERVAHAYLFTGPRGVGKTTAARILAKAINCTGHADGEVEPCLKCPSCDDFETQRSLSIFEIDAASNNKVEDIRELRENILIPPQGGHRKIYIIDEVHMLSNAAFNALLKTLEEPPPHVLFIFATTEPHKVLPTILSRCQRFDFRRIPTNEIVRHLHVICQQEEITADDDALHLIAHKGDGALRDALSVFDQAVALCGSDLKYSTLTDALRVVDMDLYFETTTCIADRATGSILSLADRVISDGYDIKEFLDGLAEHARNLLVARTLGVKALVDLSKNLRERYTAAASEFSETILLRLLMIIDDTQTKLPTSNSPRLAVELALVKMTRMADSADLAESIEQIRQLGKTMNSTTSARTRTPASSSPAVNPQPSPTPAFSTPTVAPQPAPAQPKQQPVMANPADVADGGKPAIDLSKPSPVPISHPVHSSPPAQPNPSEQNPIHHQTVQYQSTPPPPDPNTLAEYWNQVLMHLDQQHSNIHGVGLLRNSQVLGMNHHILEVAVPSEIVITALNNPRLTQLIEQAMMGHAYFHSSQVRFISRPELFPEKIIDPQEEFDKLKASSPALQQLDESFHFRLVHSTPS